MIYFCANSPFDLYRSISFCDIGFMSYMFISRTFAFLLPLKIPHIPQTIYISLFFAATVIFESEVKVKVLSDSLWPNGLYSPWNSPGQNTEVGSLPLFQGIFPTQGLNPGLPHCRQILYLLSHKGSPRILEWVAYPFSSRSSWPRNQTGVSCIAGGFFTNWAIREAYCITLFRIHFIFTLTSVDMEVHVQRPWWCWCWCSVMSNSLWPHAL